MKADKRPHVIKNFQNMPRCGAKTRSGNPCKNPCIKNRPRCRMHGCADGAGGQLGNKNAWKHGNRSREAIQSKKETNALMRRMREIIRQMAADRNC